MPTKTMTTAPQCAHPLKGIICTNEDPTRCFACSGLMHRDEGFIHCCCGAMICDNCKLKADQSSTGGYDPCVLCHGNWASIKALKKHAKRGSAWAQHALGKRYATGGTLVKKSYEESKLWYIKAARQNHPDALHNLGRLYKEGIVGGRVDLEKARDLVLRAMDIDPESSKVYELTLVGIAECYLYDGIVDTLEGAKKALDILVPLTGMDPENTDANIQARHQLAYALSREGDLRASYGWYCSTVLSAAASPRENIMGTLGESISATSTYNAMICCGADRLSPTAQRIFWARLAQKECVTVKLNADKRLERAQKIVETLQAARKLRDICGGCGAEFEGKERKFCRGCKAFCYCSRECQKMHWNRKKDGHREDCKGAMELKRKLKEARKEAAGMTNDN